MPATRRSGAEWRDVPKMPRETPVLSHLAGCGGNKRAMLQILMQLSRSLGSRPRHGRIQQQNRAPAGAPCHLAPPRCAGTAARWAGSPVNPTWAASLPPCTLASLPRSQHRVEGYHLPRASWFYLPGFSACSALPAPAPSRLAAPKPLAFPKNCSRCNLQLEGFRNRKEGTAPRRTPGGCLPGAN